MQYVRSLGGSVSKTWNSINPATLSGAIDVVVVEQEDGSLHCSPFHVRFGKFSLLRPSDKKVEFKVNDVKQDYAMKLGDGGEAFFVFETDELVPPAMQTSPVVSPTQSPQPGQSDDVLQEPDFLDLSQTLAEQKSAPDLRQKSLDDEVRALKQEADVSAETLLSENSPLGSSLPTPTRAGQWLDHKAKATLERSTSAELLPLLTRGALTAVVSQDSKVDPSYMAEIARAALSVEQEHPNLPRVTSREALERAASLRAKLSESNIPSQLNETGDLMLDMTGYKSSEENALRAEVIARKILSEELEGNYDIGALIGVDTDGNLWIYSSEEAKERALRKNIAALSPHRDPLNDAASDPGYQSDGESSATDSALQTETLSSSMQEPDSPITLPSTPPSKPVMEPMSTKSYAKTLRLTSDQLKALSLKSGANSISFTVNRATCTAYMYYWKCNVPVLISDIDGTITKSDALGHVLNMIGRDWTHLGVAKLYTDIVANGYNILYLTSRSVGQADTTRAYLNGVLQDGYRLPKGPVILSPDRTIAALRREVYLRKPEVFKMACLRDILTLFGPDKNPFYAGFGNRFTDALSYRSVNIPSNRIFTINSNAEVSLDLLTMSRYRSSYVSMREVVDHFFPPVGYLVTGGGEEFTDFTYWREPPLEVDDFSASESGDDIPEDEDQDNEDIDDDEPASSSSDDEENEMSASFMSTSLADDNDNEGNYGVYDDMELSRTLSGGSVNSERYRRRLDRGLSGSFGRRRSGSGYL